MSHAYTHPIANPFQYTLCPPVSPLNYTLRPTNMLGPPPGFGYLPTHHPIPTQYVYPTQPTPSPIAYAAPTQLASQPTVPTCPTVNVNQAQPTLSDPTAPPIGQLGHVATSGQATILPHAFTTGTLHDPTIGAWNMDTGASSHLNASVNSLSNIFNTCMYPSVSVGG
jgi:hypothetical protein